MATKSGSIEALVLPADAPSMAQRGALHTYHFGLVEDAPFDYITVPTVVLQGLVRGKAVSVPKRTAQVRMVQQNLVHTEGVNYGSFETLYDVEVEGFLKYCDSHIFRKIADYEVPETKDGRATGGKTKKWRADIESKDPGQSGGSRGLHDEEAVSGESIANYVWIVPANMGRDGKPIPAGAQETIAAMRKAGTFFFPRAKAEPVKPEGKTK